MSYAFQIGDRVMPRTRPAHTIARAGTIIDITAARARVRWDNNYRGKGKRTWFALTRLVPCPPAPRAQSADAKQLDDATPKPPA